LLSVTALPAGMNEADIQTPCLVLDLGALRTEHQMGDFAKIHGMRHRVMARCTVCRRRLLQNWAGPVASAAKR
jgi:hypothetical protein